MRRGRALPALYRPQGGLRQAERERQPAQGEQAARHALPARPEQKKRTRTPEHRRRNERREYGGEGASVEPDGSETCQREPDGSP